jgi:hypothetical protein
MADDPESPTLILLHRLDISQGWPHGQLRMIRIALGLALAALALPALAQNADDPRAWAVAWLEQAASDPDKALERMR